MLAAELAGVARLIEEARRRILEATRLPEPEGGWRTVAFLISNMAVEWRAGVMLALVKIAPLLLAKSGRARQADPLRLIAYTGLSGFKPGERGEFMYALASASTALEILKRVEPDALFIYQAASTFPPEPREGELPVDVAKICRELRSLVDPSKLHEAVSRGVELLSSALRPGRPQPLLMYLSEYCAMAAALAELDEAAKDAGVPVAWMSRCSRRLSRVFGLEAWVTDEALLSFAWGEAARAAIHVVELADSRLAKQVKSLAPMLAACRAWYYKLGPAGGIGRVAQRGSLSEGWYLLSMLASAADKQGRLRAVERGAALTAIRREELERAWSHVRHALSTSPLHLLLS